VGVAFTTLSVFAALVLYQASRNVSSLVREEHAATVSAVASAAGAAYAANRTWDGADHDTTLALAAEAGGTVTVLNRDGERLAGQPMPLAEGVAVRPVVVDGTRVGTVRVAFASGDRPAAVRHLRDALTMTVVVAAALAAALAVGVAVAVARRITRSLGAVTSAARAVEGGDPTARVGDIGAPGELGQLADAFDRMADTLAREGHARRALVADVAHELRTPLTTLRASLEGLADGMVEPTRPQLVSLHDDVLRLGRVVEDLEALAAAEAAGLSLTFGVIDLGGLARDAAATLAPQFEAAAVELDLRIHPVLVRADPYRLSQVLTNLLTNALKFTPAGGAVSVVVESDGSAASLVVSDTGIGIPAEDQPRVFDRFWRGRHSRPVAGSGIGLTVVAELVRAHGGNVAVESAPGEGTRMTVTLPSP
jgi:two-component system sensor histidine kinase BaeS